MTLQQSWNKKLTMQVIIQPHMLLYVYMVKKRIKNNVMVAKCNAADKAINICQSERS